MRIDELENIVISLRVEGVEGLKDIPIDKLMEIDESNYIYERQHLPELFSTFALLAAEAHGTELDMKMEMEVLKAQLETNMRLSLKADGEKPTERMLEMKILSNKQFQESYRKYIQAKKQSVIISKIESALIMKKEMLMSLAADKRAERASYG